jgi:hypothetical protein
MKTRSDPVPERSTHDGNKSEKSEELKYSRTPLIRALVIRIGLALR